MSRLSTDVIDSKNVVKDGFNYDLQVWVVDYIIQDCGHPVESATGEKYCCNAGYLAGEDIRNIKVKGI